MLTFREHKSQGEIWVDKVVEIDLTKNQFTSFFLDFPQELYVAAGL